MQITPTEGIVSAPAQVQPPIRIATWNVQGARLLARRKLIDAISHQHDIDLLCLQDGRFYTANYSTEHYDWIASSASTQACRKFGCYLLVRKTAGFKHHQFEIGMPSEESYVLCAVRRQQQTLIVLNAYLPCNGTPGASPAFELLDTILTKLYDKYPTIPLYVCGELLTNPDMAGLLGPHLLHSETNENGELLAGITSVYRLGTATTLFSSSTYVTRTHGNTQSQLDHILIHENMKQNVISLYGAWQPFSDHKLIVMEMSSSADGNINSKIFCVHPLNEH